MWPFKSRKPEHPPAILLMLSMLDYYLDKHYLFRADEKYRGFGGILRAWRDAFDAEEAERRLTGEHIWKEPQIFASDPRSLEIYLNEYREAHKNHNFRNTLLDMIAEKRLSHIEVYKRARIDRKLFSKIKTNIDYIPSKKTVFALAIGMGLDLAETNSLLEAAGYHLSNTILFDVIMEFFISQHNYDLYQINLALYQHNQPVFE